MPNAKKVQEVEELKDLVSRAQTMMLADYRGLSVAEMEILRRKMRDNAAQFRVVKNRLMKIALSETGVIAVDEKLTGPTGVAFGFDDPVTMAKLLLDFAKEHNHFELKGGILGDEALEPDGIQRLSKMPGLQELRAQLAGSLKQPLNQVVNMMQEPAQQIANSMNDMLNKMLYVFQGREQQLEGQ